MDDLAREVLRQVVVARPCDVVALVGPCFDTEEETRRRRVRRDARLRVLHLEECAVEDDGRDSRVWYRLATFDDALAAAACLTLCRRGGVPPLYTLVHGATHLQSFENVADGTSVLMHVVV